MVSDFWAAATKVSLIARFMVSTWGPSGADRTQMSPMLAPWSLLSGMSARQYINGTTFVWSDATQSIESGEVKECRRGLHMPLRAVGETKDRNEESSSDVVVRSMGADEKLSSRQGQYLGGLPSWGPGSEPQLHRAVWSPRIVFMILCHPSEEISKSRSLLPGVLC